MWNRSAVLATVTVLLAACSPKGPAQSPPASSAVPSGASATPTADKSSAPASAGPAPTGAPWASAQPAADARAPETPPAAAKQPEPPQFHQVTIPAGTVLTIGLTTPIASDTSKVEDAVRGSLTKP